MADQRGQQNTHDTGSSTARARDDLRTGSKKKKPNDQRDEGRDQEQSSQSADQKPEENNETKHGHPVDDDASENLES